LRVAGCVDDHLVAAALGQYPARDVLELARGAVVALAYGM
jgi:hypothetical protein